MIRHGYKQLIAWKNSLGRKPLVVQGARQVGKTFLLKEFAQKNYQNVIYLNFEENLDYCSFFQNDISPKKILAEIEVYKSIKIDINNSILIFDEIQNCPRALTSLKYFCEDLPQLAVCAAGSLLGVTLTNESYPVGKVEYLNLYPLNYFEFLQALYAPEIYLMIENSINKLEISESLHLKLWENYKEYLVIGGLPEVVKKYIETKDFALVRSVQGNILNSYYADFAKHSGKNNSIHLQQILANVPVQLARNIDGNSEKYQFKNVIEGVSNFGRLSSSINWLTKANLIYKINILDTIKEPLSAFVRENNFKLYLFDVGMLGYISNTNISSILKQDYGTYKGYYAENFVAQELMPYTLLFAWKENEAEIEFVVQSNNNEIVPIEVKSGKNVKSKSLNSYINRYQPIKSVKLSALNQVINSHKVNLPIYLARKVLDLI